MPYQKATSAADIADPAKMPTILAAPDCIAWIKTHPVGTIYRYPERKPIIPFLRGADLMNLKEGFPHSWTEAFAEELKQETGFLPFEEVPSHLSPEEEAAIAAGKPCPRCEGHGYEFILSGGELTPILAYYRYRCPCDRVVRFFKRWNAVVPELFRDVRLDDTMQPIDGLLISKADQAHVIAAIKANPTHSFFLYGAPEKGKTHMLTALFRLALENEIKQQDKLDNLSKAVFRVTTNRLLNEIRQYSLRKEDDCTPTPAVTVKKLQLLIAAGFRVSLFLEEFDKIKASDWEMIQLCELINMVYEAKGQIVATSNKSPESLIHKWDSDQAGTTIRRIGRDKLRNTAHTINFDNPKPQVDSLKEVQGAVGSVKTGGEKIVAPPLVTASETEEIGQDPVVELDTKGNNDMSDSDDDFEPDHEALV
jgi:hypothetical protein